MPRSLLAATLLLTAFAFAQKPGSNHDRNYIAREVRHELLMLPHYNVFDNLTFRVDDDGTVTLQGQVTQPVLKEDAGRVARKVDGVSGVRNEIEVLPPAPEDDRIRAAAFRAIYGEAALNRYAHQAVPPIHIIVKNGHIALEGVVATQADKNLAGIRANAVPGTFAVTNNLRVEE